MTEKAKSAENDLYMKAQRRLVGSLLAEGESTNRVLELVNREDFEEPSLQIIFDAISENSRKDIEISLISVAQELDDKGKLEEVGGAAELYSLRTSGLQWRLEASSELYAKIVKENSAKHRLKILLTEKIDEFRSDSGKKSAEIISEMQSAMNSELYKLSDENTLAEVAGSMDEYENLLEERRLRSLANADMEGLQGIPSLLPKLNSYTNGWQPGTLVTIGARTGVGKSVFAVNVATAAAKAGRSVLFFSLEMGESELKDRMVSSISGIPLNDLKKGILSDDEKRGFQQKKSEIDSLKILLDTDPKITVDTIRSRSLKRAQSPDGLDLVIIDYLQLITPTTKLSSRQEVIADISRSLKLLSKQLQVPIVVLVQLKRATGEEDDDSIPILDSIRESGAIAQDSDIVILLHRAKSSDDIIPKTLVVLAKNRNGESEKHIWCHSNLECSVFIQSQNGQEAEEKLTDADFEELDNYDDDDDLDLDNLG